MRLTVLAVDDNDPVLMNTVTILEDLGFRVLEAPSGAEVLQSLTNNQVDLVITALPEIGRSCGFRDWTASI